MRIMAGILLVALAALPGSGIAQDEAAPMDARYRPPPGQSQGGLEAIVHRDTMFNGPFVSVRNNQTNLNLGWDARSIRVRSGEWQICTGRNFTGRCTTIERDTPVLDMRFRSIESMRPTGGWGSGVGESLRGASSEFFPAPMRNGQRIPCTGSQSSCARQPANQFCRSVGWLIARTQAVETVNGRSVVADVLCARGL